MTESTTESLGVRSWDGTIYERISAPMEQMALQVLVRLPLRGGETVLDAGCGSGRVTRHLVERLRSGKVIACDASESMVEQVASVLRPQDEALVADLSELELGQRVDAVFSAATFHWVPDHDVLFTRLAAALWPGGKLVAQCGGSGNVAAVEAAGRAVSQHEPYSQYLADVTTPLNFPTVEATTERLERCGFTDIECWNETLEVVPEEPETYVGSICLGYLTELLPAQFQAPFVAEVLGMLPSPTAIEYVRLNIDATRAG